MAVFARGASWLVGRLVSFAGVPKPRVYVETTIPNFYYDRRTDPEIVERRLWTHTWWRSAAEDYELTAGAPVLAELLAGITPRGTLGSDW